MKIVLLLRASEKLSKKHSNFLCGHFSFIAKEEGLFFEKTQSSARCDICVVSAGRADKSLAPLIYRAAKARGTSSVFLDSNSPLPELEGELQKLGAKVFSPLISNGHSPFSVPVAELSSSGGDIREYLGAVSRRFPTFAVSICPQSAAFTLPLIGEVSELSQKEALRISDTYGAPSFFSPQLLCNYFLYNPRGDEVSVVLSDNAKTVSEKLRLAKELHAAYAFLPYSEVKEILDDLIL